MKKLFLILFCIIDVIFSASIQAQIKEPVSSKPSDKKINTPLFVKAKCSIYRDDFGQTFNSIDLTSLPFRNINSVANMVVGVNSYGGGIPNIKGAPSSGTAYYVDGIRVHSAIPNLR
jgi:hypothetical protein